MGSSIRAVLCTFLFHYLSVICPTMAMYVIHISPLFFLGNSHLLTGKYRGCSTPHPFPSSKIFCKLDSWGGSLSPFKGKCFFFSCTLRCCCCRKLLLANACNYQCAQCCGKIYQQSFLFRSILSFGASNASLLYVFWQHSGN